MDKLNPTTVIKYSYLIAFALFIVAGLVSSNIFLLGLTIFLIGALLAGAQSSLLPLAAIFYPAVCRGWRFMDAWYWSYRCNFRCFLWLTHFTFNLSLSGIFFILALPTFISFIALSLKVIYEKSKTNKC